MCTKLLNPEFSYSEKMSVILRYLSCKFGEGIKIIESFFGFHTDDDTSG